MIHQIPQSLETLLFHSITVGLIAFHSTVSGQRSELPNAAIVQMTCGLGYSASASSMGSLFLSCTYPWVSAFIHSVTSLLLAESPWPCWLYPLKACNQGGHTEQQASAKSCAYQQHKTVQYAYSGEATREAALKQQKDWNSVQHSTRVQCNNTILCKGKHSTGLFLLFLCD